MRLSPVKAKKKKEGGNLKTAWQAADQCQIRLMKHQGH